MPIFIIQNMNSLKTFELIIDCENFLHNWMIDVEIPDTLILKMLSYFFHFASVSARCS